MARTNSRERLIEAALTLFSQKGFDGTGVDEIAESIGIKGPTIYKYFKSKDELLTAVAEHAEDDYNKGMGFASNLADKIKNGSELIEFATNSLHFTIESDSAIKMRRLAMMEQFRNKMLAELTTSHQVVFLKGIYSKVFRNLMDLGKMPEGDSDTIALEFIAPVTLMIQMVDREPYKMDEAFEMIKKHMDIFVEKYEIAMI